MKKLSATEAARALAARRVNPGRKPKLRKCPKCQRKVSARDLRLPCPHDRQVWGQVKITRRLVM